MDGPGFRFVLFVQGCELNCEGCHNPQSMDPNGGTEISVDDIIAQMRKNPLTDGLTISGGEPFLQSAQCAQIAEAARESGLNVWVYTGFVFEELLAKAKRENDVRSLLELTDVLVDGPFLISERSLSLKWRGSNNQRTIDVQNSLLSGKTVEVQLEVRNEE